MNKYGQMALLHWQATAPSRVAELTDPATFFEALGLEMRLFGHWVGVRLAGW